MLRKPARFCCIKRRERSLDLHGRPLNNLCGTLQAAPKHWESVRPESSRQPFSIRCQNFPAFQSLRSQPGSLSRQRIFAGLVRQATKKGDRERRSPSAFSKTVVQTIHMSDCWISTPLNHLSTEILVPYSSLTEYLRQPEPLLFHHKQQPFRNQQYHKRRCRHMGHSRSAQGGRQRVERSVS